MTGTRRQQTSGGARLTCLILAAGLVLLAGGVAVRGVPLPPAGARAVPGPASVRHDLRVTVEPATSRIVVADRVRLPATGASVPAFVLSSRLRITRATPEVEEVALGAAGAAWGGGGARPAVKRYRLRTMPAGRLLTLEYDGIINFPLSDQKEEYTRGFRQTRGSVSREGVYLAGETAWYPQFGPGLVAFSIEARATADGWHLVSEGSGTSRGADGIARWNSPEPQEEIYLVGGPLVAASRRAETAEVLVYLHKRDNALADRYLTAGAQYLAMYSTLIGRYPYDKFALIENYWETGYGMPSFTLLGAQVIRFPFILHSSFPHEILHNWWGNGVFVDYSTGNWCEGLTAYLSDHLIPEQQGLGADYRRDVLQRYRDYVREGRDFALAEFTTRESAATEAIGYGKAMMVFHQLRRAMGDGPFTAMLRRLYSDYRGRRASWKDVQRVAELTAGRGFASFFAQWLSRPGAPTLRVRDVVVRPGEGGYVVAGSLAQVQEGTPYRITVPVAVQMSGDVVRRQVSLDRASATFEIACPRPPLALVVDPDFDVFRTLSAIETPPSVGQIFGEPRVLAVLPSRASARMLAAYRTLLGGWQTASHLIDIALDSEVATLPADRAVWFLGAENTLAPTLFARSRAATAVPARGRSTAASVAGRTSVLVTRHPGNPEKAIGWITTDLAAALPALGRKLPHYGKYSYLDFEGADAVNRGQGQTPDGASPLRVDLRPASDRTFDLPPLPRDSSKPLATTPR